MHERRGFLQLACALLIVVAMATACVSTPAASSATEPAAPSRTQAQPTASAQTQGATGAYLELKAKAEEALALNKLAEGLRLYVAAMARARKDGREDAVSELTKTVNEIGARLTMSAHESWLLPDGTQTTGDIRLAAKGQGLMPAVYLYESYGSAKTAVGDAVIRFVAVQNAAAMTESVSTDHRGLANTTINSIRSQNEALVIRAYPVFSAEGFSFALATVFRDFSYAPPSARTIVAGLERTPAGYRDAPVVLDTAAAGLKALGMDTQPFNGMLAPDRFMKAYGGDAAELKKLNETTGPGEAGYFALLLVELGPASQMQYQGKTYNIFTADASYTLRILRSDGTLVYSESKMGIRGQGGNADAAGQDALSKAREALEAAMRTNAEAIKASLAR